MSEPIETKDAPGPVGPYSQAVKAGPFIFVSGQIGSDPKTGRLVADDLERQTQQTLDNVEAVLRAAGADWNHVIRVEIFLIDLRDLDVVNALYGERVQGVVQPTRQAFSVSGLPARARIEISCIAHLS